MLFAAGRLSSMRVLRTLSIESQTFQIHSTQQTLYAPDRWQQRFGLQRQRPVRTHAAMTGVYHNLSTISWSSVTV